MSAAPRTMQARLVSRRCGPARRWLSADRCGRGAALARGRRGTPVRRSRSCAPRSGRDGLGRLGAGLCIYAYMRRWQGSWERGRFEICRSKKSRLSGASRAIGAWATQDGAKGPVNTSIDRTKSMYSRRAWGTNLRHHVRVLASVTYVSICVVERVG